MSKKYDEIFESVYTAPNEPKLIWYCFRVDENGLQTYYGNNFGLLGGEGATYHQEPACFQITVYAEDRKSPDWFKSGIIYHIFVDRFCRGPINLKDSTMRENSLMHCRWDDLPFYIKDTEGRIKYWTYFGGNLLGIVNKLPYLESLGISTLYLSPVFEANSSHKYNTGDYKKIDPMFGGDEAFDHLISEAAKHDISIILDGVFSHTGSDSRYFNKTGYYDELGAYQSSSSKYFPWYRFKNYPNEYESWWNVDDLPNVNEMEPSYRDFIISSEDSVIKRWMKKGVKGWRLDVADELPTPFIKELRAAMDNQDEDSVLIGEVWEDASNKFSYGERRSYLIGSELHSVTNYPLRSLMLNFLISAASSQALREGILRLKENYPPDAFNSAMNLIGSHDSVRILTLLGRAPDTSGMDEESKRRFKLSTHSYLEAKSLLKCISFIQMLLPGVPCIYYGDEAGMQGFEDPYNRGAYPWGHEDNDILLWYRRITHMRLEYEPLTSGSFQISTTPDENLFIFWRNTPDECILAIVNRSSEKHIQIDIASDSILNYSSFEPIIKTSLEVIDLMDSALEGNPGDKCVINVPPYGTKAFLFRKIPNPLSLPPFKRAAGILMHITSLPSACGVGDLGPEAYRFADFLATAAQSYWQLLPIITAGPTGSPYDGDSAFAGNIMLISPEILEDNSLIKNAAGYTCSNLRELMLKEAYSVFISSEYNLLKNKHSRFSRPTKEGFENFCIENSCWLDDYSLFKTLEKIYGSKWSHWPQALAAHIPAAMLDATIKYKEEIEIFKFSQYIFDLQMSQLKEYVNHLGIKIIGDMPFCSGAHSCDAWCCGNQFMLEPNGEMDYVVGVPPDGFTDKGQIWNMPPYNVRAMEKDGYSFLFRRVLHSMRFCDTLRLDHFRGFESFYVVKAASSSNDGFYLKGLGKRFFETLFKEMPGISLIAEDLGTITPEVNNLRKLFSFTGTRVFQFEGKNIFSNLNPYNAAYTGTHDNQTLAGWLSGRSDGADADVRVNVQKTIRELYKSNAALVILPLQDILGLGDEARMNTPGEPAGNWKWQLKDEKYADNYTAWLKKLAQESGRI